MIAWIQARAASIITVLLFAAPLLAFALTIAAILLPSGDGGAPPPG